MPAAAQALQDEPQATASLVLPDVFVLDNVLTGPMRQQVNDFLCGPGWKFGHKSSARRDMFSFWSRRFAGYHKGTKSKQYDCADELRQTVPLLHGFWNHLAGGPFRGRTLVRCYANAHTYGSDGTVHTDSKRDDSHTAVYYPHEVWEPDWAGETIVFDAGMTDIIAAVYPKPNRLFVFKGNLPHVARGVSRTCPVLRVTLMFKTFLDPIDSRDEDEADD
jgi:SM-20-related protein